MFQVGEIALVRSIGGWRECEILERPGATRRVPPLNKRLREGLYLILLDGKPYSARPQSLRKLPPPDTLTTWDNCIWRPSNVTA